MTPTDDTPWRDLLVELAEARRGDPAADALWDELDRRVRRVAFALAAGNRAAREDLDDAVQAVLLKLQSPAALAGLAAVQFPPAYVARMVRNAVTDAARRRSAERAAGRAAAMDRTALAGAEPEDPEPDMLARARRALGALPPADRELIEMRFLSGLTFGEIAARSGRSYTAVAVASFRALRKLRAAVTDA